jgi:hypothetical protein
VLGAFVLTIGFALLALLSAPSDVARMSAAMFTISYSEALLIAVLSGAVLRTPWMWTPAYGQREDRTPTHGYEATREAARLSRRVGGGPELLT